MEVSKNQILNTLNVLFEPGDVVEMRCADSPRINGFYKDFAQLASDAAELRADHYWLFRSQ